MKVFENAFNLEKFIKKCIEHGKGYYDAEISTVLYRSEARTFNCVVYSDVAVYSPVFHFSRFLSKFDCFCLKAVGDGYKFFIQPDIEKVANAFIGGFTYSDCKNGKETLKMDLNLDFQIVELASAIDNFVFVRDMALRFDSLDVTKHRFGTYIFDCDNFYEICKILSLIKKPDVMDIEDYLPKEVERNEVLSMYYWEVFQNGFINYQSLSDYLERIIENSGEYWAENYYAENYKELREKEIDSFDFTNISKIIEYEEKMNQYYEITDILNNNPNFTKEKIQEFYYQLQPLVQKEIVLEKFVKNILEGNIKTLDI